MIQARIFLIGLGGTISLILENGRAKATDNLSNLIERADLNGLHTQWDTHDFFVKDGGDITLEDLFNLADFIASKSASFDGFIVTTGTDTLEEIAYGLDLLLDCTTNVVVSGAMPPAHLCGWHPSFLLFDHPNYLGFGKTTLSHLFAPSKVEQTLH